MDAHITEMDSTIADELVAIDKDVLKNVSEGDSDPLFVTMSVLSEGVSKNRRNYSRELVEEVAKAINEKRPNGYQGHLTKEERATKAPDPLVMWLGAQTKEENGKLVLYARGYVMPYASKFKTYLRKAKALGKNVAMSIQGTAEKAVYNAKTAAYDLQGFALDSVDFAREGSEGVPNNGTLILASEMEDEETNKGDNAVDKIQVLQNATVTEMREHNPALISEIEANATNDQLVSEMAEITELVGENPKEAIAEMQQNLRKAELKNELATQVKASGARPVIENMVLSEMEANADKSVSEMVADVLRTDDAKAVLGQFQSTEPKIAAGKQKPEAKATRQFTVKR
jgi:hypothetical protein